MFRLNQRAFEILKAEILRRTGDDVAGQTRRSIAFRRLEKLCTQTGAPVSLAELREMIADLFPDFSERVLRDADRANRPIMSHRHIRATSALLAGAVGLVGGIWVLNLPYPPIRWTVARVAPMVLLPSFISMDKNYREAIAATEQADQLVNQATSAADLDLGTTKVKTAQKSLDALPVWFLGYYPQSYCQWFQCTWRFTLDEFQDARKEVARMDAKLFQEKNAQAQLEQADQAMGSAKQQYQESSNEAEKRVAIAQWQQAIDQLHQLPEQTLAGRMARPKLTAYERDFAQVSGLATGTALTDNLTQAAQLFAQKAQQLSAGTAHTVDEWESIQHLWREAIARLEKVNETAPDYSKAQELLVNYKVSADQTQVRLNEEQAAVKAYQDAKRLREDILATTPNGAKSLSPSQVGQLRAIADVLETVKPHTTVYADAQAMLKAANSRLK